MNRITNRRGRSQLFIAVGLLATGLVLMAASLDPGLPKGYWDQPAAAVNRPPHDWSDLEANLHPEACAQCHQAQFALWRDSRHAQAYSSGMIGQFPDMGFEAGNDCLVCHAPLAEQRYRDDRHLAQSLLLKLKHPEGFDRQGEFGKSGLPLRHSGVSCAVCHLRGWQRFGPPPKATAEVGHQTGAAHGGFTATRAFEQSQFCASCHQFPLSMAINDKPLENTITEWKQSDFAARGVTCQQCHMPERRHEFRGIHDPQMVRSGLRFSLKQRGRSAVVTLTSHWIGHAFPTYVTPKVEVSISAIDASEKTVRQWRWAIVREVRYDGGWKEVRDTRLMPGERRDYVAADLPVSTRRVDVRVQVIPDHFYIGVYRSLLDDRLQPTARSHIEHALTQAKGSDYTLFQQQLPIHGMDRPH